MKARAIAVGLAVGLVGAMALLTLSRDSAQAKAFPPLAAPAGEASPEIVRVASLGSKDAARARKEMLALYQGNVLRSGPDYRMAAQVLAGSKDRNELLMAHDLAVAGLALGDPEARPLVARTEDVLFSSLGLGERYGTLKGGVLPLTPSHRMLMTGRPMAPFAIRAVAQTL